MSNPWVWTSLPSGIWLHQRSEQDPEAGILLKDHRQAEEFCLALNAHAPLLVACRKALARHKTALTLRRGLVGSKVRGALDEEIEDMERAIAQAEGQR